jgi:hypothetical protein
MMSRFMYGQVTQLPISLPVTFTPGCTRQRKAVKIWYEQSGGGALVLQRSCISPNLTFWCCCWLWGVWAGPLGLGNGCIVDLDWACGNSVDIPWWWVGEGVCHCIV